jgi:hypothetical protein
MLQEAELSGDESEKLNKWLAGSVPKNRSTMIRRLPRMRNHRYIMLLQAQ